MHKLFAVIERAHFHVRRKGFIKMGNIPETTFKTNIRNAFVRFSKLLGGKIDAIIYNRFHKSFPRHFLEEFAKCVRRHSDNGCCFI